MLRLAVVLLGFAIGGLALIRSPFGALLFYIWFAVFRPQEWLWIDISAARPSFVIGALLVARCLVSGALPSLWHPLTIGSVVFFGCGLLAQHDAVAPEMGWFWIGYLGKLILIGLFVVRLTSTRDRFYALIATIAISFAFFSAKAGLASFASGGVHYLEGLAGAFSDSNGYAVGCVMVIPLLIATAQNTTFRPAKWLIIAAVPLTAFTVVSTYSRGGFLAMVSATVVWVLLQRRRVLIGLTLGVVLAMGLAFVPLPKGYADRLQTIETYNDVQENSALSRLHVWTVALQVAKEKPLGIGFWGFESIYDRYDFSGGQFGSSRAIHNSHLEALVEAGWGGGAVWLVLLGTAFWTGGKVFFRSRRMVGSEAHFFRTMSTGIVASLSGFVVGGSFVSLAYNDLTWLLFAALAALDRVSRQAEIQISSNEEGPTTVSAVPAPA